MLFHFPSFILFPDDITRESFPVPHRALCNHIPEINQRGGRVSLFEICISILTRNYRRIGRTNLGTVRGVGASVRLICMAPCAEIEHSLFPASSARPPTIPGSRDRQQFTHLAGSLLFLLFAVPRAIVKPAGAFCAEFRPEMPNCAQPGKTWNARQRNNPRRFFLETLPFFKIAILDAAKTQPTAFIVETREKDGNRYGDRAGGNYDWSSCGGRLRGSPVTKRRRRRRA